MVTPPLSQQIDLYCKDTKVWFADDKEGWVSASCLTKQVGDKVTLVFQNDEDPTKVTHPKTKAKAMESSGLATISSWY